MPGIHAPKHRQLERHLRHLIESGRFRPGERLPSEVSLAAEHDYSPGTVRRALSTLVQEGLLAPRRGSGVYVQEKPRQKIIGVIVPNVINPDHAGLVQAVTQGASARGYSTVLYCAGDDWRKYPKTDLPEQFQFVERVAGLRPAGIIACPTTVPLESKLRERLRALDIPYVVTNDYWTDCRDEHHLRVDQGAAARLAVEYLAGLGHRRIALWIESSDDAWKEAVEAFVAEMRSRGLLADEDAVFMGSGPDWVRRNALAEREKGATAVIAPYYQRAYHLLDAVRSAGVRVPEELSLVCLGGHHSAQPQGIDFTATVSPIRRLAERALDILLDDKKQDERFHVVFKPTLHIGTTTRNMAEADALWTGDGSLRK